MSLRQYRPPVILSLSEIGEPTSVGAQFRKGLRDERDLAEAIKVRLRREYERESKSVLGTMYEGSGKEPPKFSVGAQWKKKQLNQYADRVSASMARTMRKEEERLALKYPDDKAARREALSEIRKAKQADLEQAISAEARLQATADQLVHSGAVNPKTAKIMRFMGPVDMKACGYCLAVMQGNPWTIDQATNYGAKLHPHCRHWWESHWEVETSEMQVVKRKVRDGELRGWSGSSQTPMQGSAREAAKAVSQHKDGWPLSKRAAVRQLRKAGVPEDDVNALLNAKQRAGRMKRVTRSEQERRAEYLRWRPGDGDAK